MLQDLEQVEHRCGLLEKGITPKSLPVNTWKGAKIPKEFYKQMHEENLLNLGGNYGKKEHGDPQEYDHLRLILTDDVVDIKVYNRGISLMQNMDKNILRIHRCIGALGKQT